MSARVLEAVPNFSEGRDARVIESIVAEVRAAGAEVLDWSSDPDHNRSVITLVGTPEIVEEAALAAARAAVELIDLRGHEGVHPRIGALDVLPFVPLVGTPMEVARASAHRVGRALAEEVGVPVYFYAEAADPPGRRLSDLRRGGYERLVTGWPADREPDLLPEGWGHPGIHPTAGATCVGARLLLLAWNVFVTNMEVDLLRRMAASLRESGGGFRGLRTLVFELPRQRALQISMNLEDAENAEPFTVFQRLEELITGAGGQIVETEVIGMIPDSLLAPAAADRLRLQPSAVERQLSRRLAAYLATH